jgi:hypothetical protein
MVIEGDQKFKIWSPMIEITIVGDVKRVLVTKLLVTKNGVQLKF